MFRRTTVALAACASMLLAGAAAANADHVVFKPGAPGLGDPYYPLDGNGGYDVQHYLLDIGYTPQTDVLVGTAAITARATQNLASFNLDLNGLTVRSITVNGRSARWSRAGTELTVTPRSGLRSGRPFVTVVHYDGVPVTINDPFLGLEGFIHTNDGAVVLGEPHVASTWYPVNDHPSDKAAYTFRATVPAGLQAVANGVLVSQRTKGDHTTWTWQQSEPMASYLATTTIGHFNLNQYQQNGIKFVDAIDPALLTRISPRTGQHFLLSGRADFSYKRLTRTISVPAEGARLSFWITGDTEQNWDFRFVEAHTVGADDWTTLPDENGHTSADTGRACAAGWQAIHPFVAHYQTRGADGTCTPTGTTGSWSAASGPSPAYEQWSVDLARYAGKDVEVSISYASDDTVQRQGLFVDDIAVSTGPGSTSFEDDGDPLDGWTIPGPPPGTDPNANDFAVGTTADAPETLGEGAARAFAREPEILDFLSSQFGPYPFRAAGGIVDNAAGFNFALENQTRPIYATGFFREPVGAASVVVHELAHQWFGDSVTVASWQDIWLNEGFATYAEFLWSEREGLETAQENFDFYYDFFPADHPFWTVNVADPGVDDLFSDPVYFRGAMTLHQLRLAVGDTAFFRIVRKWVADNRDGHGTTAKFIGLAERISGKSLKSLFSTWLSAPGRPALPATATPRQAGATTHLPTAARSLVTCLKQRERCPSGR